MPKFRKLPVVVEAVQFVDDPVAISELSDWAGTTLHIDYSNKSPMLRIYTLEGMMVANIGDWVIRGVNGEFYPCKDEIFRKTYVEAQ